MKYRTIVADPPWAYPSPGRGFSTMIEVPNTSKRPLTERDQVSELADARANVGLPRSVSGYATIVVDPPWPVRQPPKVFTVGTANAPLPYPSMTVEEIAKLPVHDFAATSCHLYLWTVNRFIRDAYDVIAAWGFTPAMLLTWCKEPMGIGPGRQFASTTEFILFSWCGSQEREPKRIERNWWVWPRGGHSVKPEAFLDIVEQVSPGPYLELFARRQRLGWDTWGNEALEHVSLETS